jgi:hypothetical protein
MLKKIKNASLCALLLFAPLNGREPDVIRTDWNGLQRQLGRQKQIKHVRVHLRSGDSFNTDVHEIRDEGLIVNKQRLIPKDQVRSLRLNGKRGKGRLIGTLVGAGAGGATAAGIASQTSDITEGAFVIIRPVAAIAAVGLGALVGYLIGNAMDGPAPEFVLVP